MSNYATLFSHVLTSYENKQPALRATVNVSLSALRKGLNKELKEHLTGLALLDIEAPNIVVSILPTELKNVYDLALIESSEVKKGFAAKFEFTLNNAEDNNGQASTEIQGSMGPSEDDYT